MRSSSVAVVSGIVSTARFFVFVFFSNHNVGNAVTVKGAVVCYRRGVGQRCFVAKRRAAARGEKYVGVVQGGDKLSKVRPSLRVLPAAPLYHPSKERVLHWTIHKAWLPTTAATAAACRTTAVDPRVFCSGHLPEYNAESPNVCGLRPNAEGSTLR